MAGRWSVVVSSWVVAGSLACLAIYAAWLLVRMRTAAEQKRLVRAICSQGGIVRYAHEYIRSVPQPSPTLTSIFGLDFCARVTEVRFPKGSATDTVLRTASGLRSLESLYVGDSSITDAGLEHVASLRNLTDLSLCGTEVSDTGMKWLRGLTHLRYLDLDRTKVTDAGLEALEGLHELNVLHVCGTRVTDVGLATLRGLPKLQVLNVTAGGGSGLDASKAKRALPRCWINGMDDTGKEIWFTKPDDGF